jgi:transcriptional regulator NrdR family protein
MDRDCEYMLFVLSNTKVVNSRYFKRQNVVWRRRQSNDGVVFTTRETVDLEGLVVKKKVVPAPEKYQPGKLFISLLKACNHMDNPEETAWHLAKTIEEKLIEALSEDFEVKSTTIAIITIDTLKSFDTTAYIIYAAFHPNLVSPRKLSFAIK